MYNNNIIMTLFLTEPTCSTSYYLLLRRPLGSPERMALNKFILVGSQVPGFGLRVHGDHVALPRGMCAMCQAVLNSLTQTVTTVQRHCDAVPGYIAVDINPIVHALCMRFGLTAWD